MDLQIIYRIQHWENWLDEVDDAINDFFIQYQIYPNLLEANSHTFDQFDHMASIIPHIRKDLAEEDDDCPDIEIDGFSIGSSTLHFCICDSYEDREFSLVYVHNLPDNFDDDDDDNNDDNDYPFTPVEPTAMISVLDD